MIKFRVLLIGLALFSSARATTLLSPNAVREQIIARGARETVLRLDASGQMDLIYKQIGLGRDIWISLIPAFADSTDAAYAEGLGIELARALPLNPDAVLKVLRPGNGVIGLQRVCGLPFIETSSAWNAAYIRRAASAVMRVKDPRLDHTKLVCLNTLRG